MHQVQLSAAELEALVALSTPTVCNAIETFNIQLRNEGYVDGSIINRLPKLQPMVGYAVTVKMRTDKPPVRGFSYPDRNDWWDMIAASPAPRIIVIEDTDRRPGVGSVAGEIHASIFKALGGIGIVTNGAVRDLDALAGLDLHVYSGNVVPSHGYAHIVDIGMPVAIGNMSIETGDLLHGDRNGIAKIPLKIAADIHLAARTILNREREVTRFCGSAEFSIGELREMVTRWYAGGSEGKS